ncbi:acyltransferase family protein [Flaviflagellibacter deserti]|uniref:Acyltransferase family protein n=1 Tax=Flaviflagellibacter deserti TaxID=2267266 RepID=A0ABV9Z4G3_9HYPH
MPRIAVPETERIAWVDYSKGICIVLVVMMHSTLGVGNAAGGEGFMHHVVAFALPFRMPDFFLISGLFLSRVIDRDWRTYLDRKVIHFAYFYILWLVIQGAFRWPELAMTDGPVAVIEQFLLALIEPFGTLWFIYLLPVFFVAAKLMRNVPPVIVLALGTALQIADIHTGWTVIDETAERFVFFAIGWYAAPLIFAYTDRVAQNIGLAAIGLVAWAVMNGTLVHFDVAMLPGVSFVLGLMGAGAVVTTGVLLSRYKLAEALRYAGQNSIVVYLAFFLPMVVTRLVLLKTGVVTDVGWMSLIVTASAVITPLLLHLAVKKTGWGLFLFERPARFRLEPRSPALQPAE